MAQRGRLQGPYHAGASLRAAKRLSDVLVQGLRLDRPLSLRQVQASPPTPNAGRQPP